MSMLDEQPTLLPTYEFMCPRCDGDSVYLTYDGMMGERPVCCQCQTEMLPNLAYLRSLPNTRQSDVTIDPEMALAWLAHGFTSFAAQMNAAQIQNYVILMEHNRWIDATEDQGGKYVPIVRVQGTLMLGFNRLTACMLSGHSFTNTVIEVI